MLADRYYTLATSLPFLPPLPQNRNLPVTRQHLEKQIAGMLDPDDLEFLEHYRSYVSFSRRSEWDDRTFLRNAATFMKGLRLRELRENFAWYLEFRMTTAAIRRRELALTPPTPAEGWWRGLVLEYVTRYWDEPTFRLERRFPFLTEYVEAVRAKDMANAGRLLLEAAEAELRRAGEEHEFGLTAIIFYVLRFALIERWIAQRDEQRAAEAITGLLQRVVHSSEGLAS
jgi:hypothetical protein